MPHHMEDLERQIPYSGEHLKSNSRDMPGGGGMLKFRIDRYITLTTYSEKCESSPAGS
jgi:hypothetical protein